jgi:hypothetical protein
MRFLSTFLLGVTVGVFAVTLFLITAGSLTVAMGVR